MGLTIHNGRILETDDFQDGYAVVRAIQREEQDFKRKVNDSISDERIKSIVRQVLVEEGLIQPPRVVPNEYDTDKWELIRRAVEGDR